MSQPDEVIARYFAAMRRGAAAESELMELFADDAVYVAPFSGTNVESRGRDEIQAAFRNGWEYPLPELELEVHSIEIGGEQATARWTCRSPGLPAPVTGTDRYVIRDGRIARLEVTIDERD